MPTHASLPFTVPSPLPAQSQALQPVPLPPQPHPLPSEHPCARKHARGEGRKRKAGPLGGQKAAKQSKKKAEPAGGTSGSPRGWGLNPPPALTYGRRPLQSPEQGNPGSNRSPPNQKWACDNEPQKVALEHGDPDREHVDSESAGAQNGVVTAVEESSAVEMAAKGATAVRILEEDAVHEVLCKMHLFFVVTLGGKPYASVGAVHGLMTPNVTPSDDTKDVAPSDDTKDVTPSGDTKDVGPSDDTKDVTPSDDTKDVAPSDDTKDVAPSDDTKDVAPSDDTKDVAPSDDTKDVAPSVDTNDVARSVDTKGVATSDDTMDTSKPPQ
eukprot:Em0004g504a